VAITQTYWTTSSEAEVGRGRCFWKRSFWKTSRTTKKWTHHSLIKAIDYGGIKTSENVDTCLPIKQGTISSSSGSSSGIFVTHPVLGYDRNRSIRSRNRNFSIAIPVLITGTITSICSSGSGPTATGILHLSSSSGERNFYIKPEFRPEPESAKPWHNGLNKLIFYFLLIKQG
jgi:hypothetical protein